ncbi:MAG: hypothetical protein VKK04_25680 [Synechococcales bacterium]|nr:hypothetical protein [Synechococcales bacterium]
MGNNQITHPRGRGANCEEREQSHPPEVAGHPRPPIKRAIALTIARLVVIQFIFIIAMTTTYTNEELAHFIGWWNYRVTRCHTRRGERPITASYYKTDLEIARDVLQYARPAVVAAWKASLKEEAA